MTDVQQTIEYDMRGQICPASLLVALREINRHLARIKEGEVELVIKTDNRDGTSTIPEAAANMGLRAEVSRGERCYLITIGRLPQIEAGNL